MSFGINTDWTFLFEMCLHDYCSVKNNFLCEKTDTIKIPDFVKLKIYKLDQNWRHKL